MEEGETRDRLIGSSVLPFAVDSRWNCIYFLLAQERVVPGWSGSQTWSDFGGSAVGAADAPQTAAREFVEESMGVIKFSERHATPYTDYKPVEDAIAQGAYALSITFTMPERSSKYVTYIKQLKFDRHAVRTHHDLYCALRQKHAGIEAVGRSPRHPLLEPGRPVPDGYLEKSALRWWSIPQLNAARGAHAGRRRPPPSVLLPPPEGHPEGVSGRRADRGRGTALGTRFSANHVP